MKVSNTNAGPTSVKVLYDNQEYELKDWMLGDPDLHTYIDMPGGTLIFDEFTSLGDMACRFQLNENVTHNDPGIDVFNQKLTMQASFGGDSVATRDILVQIVDDVPIVSGEATMDLTDVEAWTLAGDKRPLSYDCLKDVLYRSTDYNDWATGFKVTNCEGKYGSTGVFGDDGNPDDPASAPGNTYYMPDPDKLAFIAPGETVTEAVQYTYTDSDGDTANGVLNIVLKGTGLNPDEAIKITPRPGNVPTSGIIPNPDSPYHNPYEPGNPSDPDRDLSSSTVTIGDLYPKNPNWGMDKDGNALLRVFESGLPPLGTWAGIRNVTAHGYLDIDSTVGLQSIIAITDDGARHGFENSLMVIPLDGGTLTLTYNLEENSIYYEFTLTNPVKHEPGNGINSDEQYVKLIATDNYGNEETIGLDVQIIDDVPMAPVGYWRLEVPWPIWGGIFISHNLELGYPANIITPGADFNFRDGKSSVLVNPMDGKYGHFEIGRYGSVPYDGVFYLTDSEKVASVKKGETITESFSYTYTDADGDLETGIGEYILHGPGLAPEVRFTVNENDLANGGIINEINVDGYGIIEVSKQPTHGTISQDANGGWRYVLSNSINSGVAQGSNIVQEADFFVLWVDIGVDNDPVGGRNVFGYVDVIDSVPTFTAGQNRLAYDFGADNGPGAALKVAVGGAETDLVPGVETMIAGQHGLLTLSADGSCNYTPNSDAAGIDRFDFTIIDSDGDRALASIEASVQDGTPQMAMSVQDADSLAAIAALGVSPETGALAGA